MNELVILVAIVLLVLFVVAVAYYFSKGNENTRLLHKKFKPGAPIPSKGTQYTATVGPIKKELKKKTNRKTIKKDTSDIAFIFKSIWRVLLEVSTFNEKQTLIIYSDCDSLKNYLVQQELKKMDVSAINIRGTKINTSVLKNNRIKTIYDLVTFPGRKYETLVGIGPKSAEKIRYNIDFICAEVRRNTHIRLSVDYKQKHTNELVKSIAIFLGAEPIIELAKKLLEFKPKVDSNIRNIKKLMNSPVALFKPQETFEKAENIYDELYSIYIENFLDINSKIVDPFNENKTKDYHRSWSDFEKNPIEFNKIIERLSKTTGVSSSGEYGLDSEIAQAVKNTPLDLNGFKMSLRIYQEWGAKYIICQNRTILGDEMGLGKTVQAIAAMVSLSNGGSSHFMVVCPLSVLTNWCREIYKFSTLRYYRLYGWGKTRGFSNWIKNGGVAVTTYESLNSLPISESYLIDLLVVDEAHYVKNPLATRTNNTRIVLSHSNRVTFLTGTVLENKVDEMIQLISYLNPSVSSSLKRNMDNSINGKISAEEFRRDVAKVYFRRRRLDVLSELPEKTEIEEWCDLNEQEEITYKNAVISHSFNDARRVSWNVENGVSTKMTRLKEIVDMAKEDGRKVLVFSFFLNTVEKVFKEFGKDAFGPINGSVASVDRQKIIDRFDNAPAGSVLVSQIQSGGTGLNIQSASVVVICEPQFKPSIENQAISRSYRMGQSRKVLVYRLLATDTVDERLNDILTAKQREFDNYADTSVVAEQSFQIDSGMFAGIMKKEYERLVNHKDYDLEIEHIEEKRTATNKQTPISHVNDTKLIKTPAGGVSVTKRIEMIKQPRGGYLPVSCFEKHILETDTELGEENISPSLVGMAVDYLTRYMRGASIEDSFKISLLGARNVDQLKIAEGYLKQIKRELDNNSVVCAIKLTGYDVAYRVGPIHFKPVDDLYPSIQTINNIREMVRRSLKFFNSYGPVVKDGFTFEGAYNKTISSGDGDFLTEDTLWDFKVTKNDITTRHSLQVLVYYLMGIRSVHPEFKKIKNLGIYNPRLNIVYKYNLEKLPELVKKEVEEYVIGYR